MSKNAIVEIADRIGVPPATVSRALNNVRGVGPARRRQILAVAEELNSYPNVAAYAVTS